MKTLSKNLVLIFILMFYSCSKVKETKDETIRKLKTKTTETSKKVWKKGVEKMFEYSTFTIDTKFEDIYGKDTGINIQNESGKQIEYVGGFYQCFFKYNSDKKSVLNFLDSLKTNKPEISDKEYLITDKQMINEKLNFIKSKFPEIYNQLSFFTEFEKKNDIEYYSINKYLHFNIIIYDKLNNQIYHFVENYKD